MAKFTKHTHLQLVLPLQSLSHSVVTLLAGKKLSDANKQHSISGGLRSHDRDPCQALLRAAGVGSCHCHTGREHTEYSDAGKPQTVRSKVPLKDLSPTLSSGKRGTYCIPRPTSIFTKCYHIHASLPSHLPRCSTVMLPAGTGTAPGRQICACSRADTEQDLGGSPPEPQAQLAGLATTTRPLATIQVCSSSYQVSFS